MNLHFLINGARHDIAGREREPAVVLLHKLLAVGQAQDAAVAAHGFGDEIGGMRFAMVEGGGGVELHELHILHGGFGPVGHGNAVARGDIRIGSCGIHSADAACGQYGDARKDGVNLVCIGVEHVGTEAFDIGRAARHLHT